MTIIENLEDYKSPSPSVVLTIGTFDGMHRGHQTVLKKAQTFVKTENEVVVLTFRNHPSEILRPEQPTPLICFPLHRILLLQQCGIQDILLLPFTRYLAQHSAESFIERVHQSIPFSHLILGHDATLGRNRQGDRRTMQSLGEMWGFQVDYVDEYRYEGKPVSSSRIREAIKEGNLALVEDLLGRPYSIYGKAIGGESYDSEKEEEHGDGEESERKKGLDRGIHEKKQMNSKIHFDLSRLCLLPFGAYEVEVIGGVNDPSGEGYGKVLATAKLFACENKPILEVNIPEEKINCCIGEYLEVVFHAIR
jgi:riboflavin kinase / FMN adenylyltransferase